MTYRRFGDLPVWNDAIDLATAVFALTGTGCLRGFAGLRDQLERATVSISNNIAEGFERGTNNELLNFLYIARGSAAEVRSMLSLLLRLPEMEDRGREIQDLRSKTESVSKQLGRWMESLKSSGFRGTRYQTAETRRASENDRR
ncbi:MAG: four helix bundle protein [Isosphaeraceae bacterium]